MRAAGIAIVALALAVVVIVLLPRPVHHTARPPAGVSQAPPATEPAVLHPEIGFRSETRLEEHYRKHGREFGSITRDRYLQLAQQLRDRPAGGLVLESEEGDGVIIRYDRSSGAFIAFERNLVIRTFFRPDRGEAYYRSKLTRSR